MSKRCEFQVSWKLMAWDCATKRIPENGVCLAPIAIGVLIPFFVKEKRNWL